MKLLQRIAAKKKWISVGIIGILFALPAFIYTVLQLYEKFFPKLPIVISEEINRHRYSATQLQRLSPQEAYLIQKADHDNKDTISFTLTNPSDNYAVLNRIWVEVDEYRGHYRFPEPGKFVSTFTLSEATSGPVERYEEKIYLYKATTTANLFKESKKVFSKGETEEFTTTIIAFDPGKYKYSIKQEWALPQGNTVYVTSTKQYLIENPEFFDTKDTYDLFQSASSEVIILSANIRNMKNIISFEVLRGIPANIDIKILKPKRSIRNIQNKTCIIFDGKKILIEIDKREDESRVGELIIKEQEVSKFLQALDIKKLANFELYEWKHAYPFLGIRSQIINNDLQKKYSLPYNFGALVKRGEGENDLAVVPGSPADKAKIMENDIILTIDNKALNGTYTLFDALANKIEGDEINLKIYHKGEEKNLSVVLGSMAESKIQPNQ